MICLHYAGGASYVFRTWANHLPGDIEMIAVQLPGRWERSSEPLAKRMETILDPMGEALSCEIGLPFAVIGFSLGSLIGFEWLHWLRDRNLPSPKHFVSISRAAPHLHTDLASIFELDDESFIRAVHERYHGMPIDMFKDPELREIFLPILKADLEVYQTYRCRERPPLSLPMTAIAGQDDPTISLDSLEKWGMHTTSGLEVKQFKGSHFFTNGAESMVMAYILGCIGILRD